MSKVRTAAKSYELSLSNFDVIFPQECYASYYTSVTGPRTCHSHHSL